MSQFLATSVLILCVAFFWWQIKGAQSLFFLKICTIIVILSGLAYAPQDAIVPPGAFSGFFGNTNIVRALATILMVAALFSNKVPSAPLSHKAVLILATFPLYMAVLSAATGEPAFTKGILGFLLRMSDIICFFSLGFWLASQGRPNEFAHFMMLVALVTVVISIFALAIEPITSLRADRFRGVSFSANWSGMYFALLVVPLFSMLLSDKRVFFRSTTLPICIALLSLLAATGSRGAFVSALIGLLIYLFLNRKSLIAATGLGILAFLAFILLPGEYSLSNLLITKRFATVENTRETVWQDGWDRWLESGDILIGSLDASNAVENQFLSILFVYGVFGVVVAIICLIAIIAQVRKARKGRPSEASNVALSMIVVFFMSCVFEAPYFGVISAFNIFLYIAVGVVFGDKARRRCVGGV